MEGLIAEIEGPDASWDDIIAGMAYACSPKTAKRVAVCGPAKICRGWSWCIQVACTVTGPQPLEALWGDMETEDGQIGDAERLGAAAKALLLRSVRKALLLRSVRRG